MPKPTLYLAALFFFLVSCSKKDNSSNTFIVNGVQDISVANYTPAPTSLSLQIAFVSGTQEPVTIAVSGVPTNVSDSIAPSSGTPTFNAVIYFTAKDATAGSYPVAITVTGASGGIKTYHLNLTVTGAIATTKWYLDSLFYTAPAKIVANTGPGPAVAAIDAQGNMLGVLLPAIPVTAKTFKVIDFMSYYNNFFSSTLDSTTCAIIVGNSTTTYYSTNNTEYITVTPLANGNVMVDIPNVHVKILNENNYLILEGVMQTQ
jgi:hypothetical protein